MIDIHCHLLPGIDDGPETLEESLELCEIAVADGISHAIVTPHIHPGRWENSLGNIEQSCHALRGELEKRSIALRLGFAGEVRLSDEILGQIERNEIPFYGELDGYRIMLLEFPHGHIIPGSEKLIEWLLRQKIRPLIAHPERNKQLMKDPQQLLPYVEVGCWLQVTAGSIIGNFGTRAQQLAARLLAEDVVTVVASDGHNAGPRPPKLKAAFTFLREQYGTARAERLTREMPAAIAANQM